jgi:hypothetical protein
VKNQNSKLHSSLLIRRRTGRNGSALILITISIFILTTLGLGLLTISYGNRHSAVRMKNEVASLLAAEAGYEKAIYWMSQQNDMLSALAEGAPGTSGTLNFPDGYCDYQIGFYTLINARPSYRIISNGHSGIFTRAVDVLVVQAISGWDMGICRVPIGMYDTDEVYFADGEVIDIPLHINDRQDYPDNRDIYIQGNPNFLRNVAMGESRLTSGGADKYASVMDLFDGGINFEQPDSKITDEETVQDKVDRFKNSTKLQYCYNPNAYAPIPHPQAAVQLEFFVEDGTGKVRITNDCTVLGYRRSSDNQTYDFKIKNTASDTMKFERYYIYSYHYMPEDAEEDGQRITIDLDDTYVTQSFGDIESEPGGQIYVEGNVIIGGDKDDHNGDQLVKGKITIVATGNIWIADSILVDGAHESDGKPSLDNPNVLGLVAQGVIKVVDPGMSSYSYDFTNRYPGEPDDLPNSEYVPIGRKEESSGGWGGWGGGASSSDNDRYLPDPMIVEAAMTLAGGGWGAENVRRGYYGGRKEDGGNQDDLVVHGTITEAIRGVVGVIGSDGYLKHYYFDERLIEGILPGDMWLGGKFIPAPAGWRDYRPGS